MAVVAQPPIVAGSGKNHNALKKSANAINDLGKGGGEGGGGEGGGDGGNGGGEGGGGEGGGEGGDGEGGGEGGSRLVHVAPQSVEVCRPPLLV